MTTPRFRPLSPATLNDLLDPCEHCGYGFVRRARTDHFGRTEDEVPSWPNEVADLWGNCGAAAHVNATTPGYLTYAPAEMVAESSRAIIGVQADAVFSAEAAVLVAVSVCRDYRGRGLGRELVRTAVAQLIKRQVGLVEVLGTFGSPTSPADSDDGMVLLPVAFWHAVGFRIVRPHPLTPTLRLDVASTVRRRPDLAAAWQRITDLVKSPGPAQPANFVDTQPAHHRPERQLTRCA